MQRIINAVLKWQKGDCPSKAFSLLIMITISSHKKANELTVESIKNELKIKRSLALTLQFHFDDFNLQLLQFYVMELNNFGFTTKIHYIALFEITNAILKYFLVQLMLFIWSCNYKSTQTFKNIVLYIVIHVKLAKL